MEQVQTAGVTMALGNFTLTGISGAATTHSSAAMAFAIRGKAFTHAVDAGVATPATDFVTGAAITLVASQARAVVWGLDSGDATRVIAGPVVSLDANSGAFLDAPAFPNLPDTFCPCAYTVHKAGSTTVGTWTFGTSNWNATGLTHAVQNIVALPDRPQTA